MALKLWTDSDLADDLLAGQRVLVVGYGAQGRAQARNLKDSGLDVVVGLREDSPSMARARADGLAVEHLEQSVPKADIIMLLLPDEAQAGFHEATLRPLMKAGAALVFAHGFNIHYQRIIPRPDVDVLLVAPKGIGDQVRSTYEAGHGVPGLVAVAQDASGKALDRALGYAQAVGHGKAVILETSFADETETDLFGEQAVLCGGLTALAQAGFDTLVEAGYPEELAYFECLHEIKLIADLMYQRGIVGMRASISTTAAYGDATRGPQLIDDAVRTRMQEILKQIRSGAFAEELAVEDAKGYPTLGKTQAIAARHPLERVGAELRGRMPFLGAGKREGSE